MAAAVEGAQVDFDTAIEIEGRYFVDLLAGQVSKNMIQAFFFDMQQVNGDRGRPEGIEPYTAKKAVVLGAGMMGAAIAYVCAKAGIEVVLKDVSLEAAERGKAYSQTLSRRPSRAGAPRRRRAMSCSRGSRPPTDPAAAAGADLVIEAVFEDPAVKAQVFAEIEPHLAPDALLGSNTSTLPITELAEGVCRPDEFIGLHFFSPVDKMPLLEIIKGEKTNDETALPRARPRQADQEDADRRQRQPRLLHQPRDRHVHQRGHRDAARGRSRAFDRAGLQPGRLPRAGAAAHRRAQPGTCRAKIRKAYQDAVEAEGGTFATAPGIRRRRPHARGRSAAAGSRGAGFYEYEDGKRTGLWKGLKDAFPPTDDPASISLKDLEERMLFAEAIESVKCLDEGVIESVADANIGSILGIGFPGWTGGVLQYINGYDDGVAGIRRPRARARREATASASSRRRRSSRRPSAVRATATSSWRSRAPEDPHTSGRNSAAAGPGAARSRSGSSIRGVGVICSHACVSSFAGV